MSQPMVLCLIHGHGVDASIWNSIYADLVLDGPVLKPDFAYLTNLTTIEEYADELYTQLQAANIEKAVLVGHSMGGYMALAFAEQHPERVQGLVLYHSTAIADTEERRKQRRQIIERLQAEGSDPFIRQQLPKMVSPTYSPDKTQTLVDRFLTLPADALIAGMTTIMGRPDRTQVLRDAQFPVLLVLGRDDQLIPYEKTAELINLSDKISVITIEKAGHLSMVEQPAASVQAIKGFLDKP